MARPGPVLKTVTSFVAAYAVAIAANAFALGQRFAYAMVALRADDAWETKASIARVARLFAQQLAASYTAALVAASLVVPLGAVVRLVARARVRSGFRDPLDRMRDFTKRRGAAWMLAATPALWWLAVSVRMALRWQYPYYGGPEMPFEVLAPILALPLGVAFVAHLLLARSGIRALLAPTLAADATKEATADGFSFDAVAVTKETIGAVAGLAGLSVVMAALAFALPTATLVRNPAFLASLLGYVGVAVGGTLLFRRASRISVGLDGVFVSGSARRRFVPFSEIDDARANGSSIVLTRGDSVVLRLQLHGEDAIRRDALAERLRKAIQTAAELRNSPDVHFVKTARQDALERAANGASSYRETAPTRDKLWDLLESPAVNAEGRKAAATALVRESSDAERVRLRVAAEHCAEPSVRARIYELLEEDEEDEEPAVTVPPRRARA